MAKVDISDILELSVEERIRLAQDIWESISADEAHLPLSDEQRTELEERLRQHTANPTDGSDWEDVQRRLRSSLGQ